MEYGSIREFRSNLRQAFEIADKGEKVVIERGGVRYLLVSENAIKEAKKTSPEKLKKIAPMVDDEMVCSSRDMLTKIKHTQKERDEKLEYCQDSETHDAIVNQYQALLDEYWIEFRALEALEAGVV